MLQDEMVASMQEDRSLGCAELNRFTFILANLSLCRMHLTPKLLSSRFLLSFRWLTMTELMSASFGEKNFSLEHWQMIKELERLRKDRLKEKAR